MNTKIKPYWENIPDWKNIVESKHILFDSDAIISLLNFNAQGLFEDLIKLDTINCIIHPILLELLASNSEIERILRYTVIEKYKFIRLQLNRNCLSNAENIQLWFQNRGCYPSPSDLYLGGTIASYADGEVLLLTSNFSDFHHPLFKREAPIILQNDKSSKVLAFLSLNKEELKSFTDSI